jgi:hypothetical protein
MSSMSSDSAWTDVHRAAWSSSSQKNGAGKAKKNNKSMTSNEYVPIVFSSDGCTRCGRAGHYENACHAPCDVAGQTLPTFSSTK